MTKLKSKLRLKKIFAFTLIELLVVIAIIGILATLAMVSYTGSQRQARDTQRKSDLKQYQAALETYANSHSGMYLTASVSLPDACSTLGASSCPSDPADLTGYQYLTTDGGASYVLWVELESKEGTYWVVCSTGSNGETTSQPSTGVCPALP